MFLSSPGEKVFSLSLLLPNLVILGFLRKSFISQARRPRHWDNDRGRGGVKYLVQALKSCPTFINIRKRSAHRSMSIFGNRDFPSFSPFWKDFWGSVKFDVKCSKWKLRFFLVPLCWTRKYFRNDIGKRNRKDVWRDWFFIDITNYLRDNWLKRIINIGAQAW